MSYYTLEDIFADILDATKGTKKRNNTNYQLIKELILKLYSICADQESSTDYKYQFVEVFCKTVIGEIISSDIKIKVNIIEDDNFFNKSNAVMTYNLKDGIKISSRFISSSKLTINPMFLVNALCHEAGHIEQFLTTKRFIEYIFCDENSNLSNYEKTLSRVIIAKNLVNIGQSIDGYLEKYDSDIREYDANMVRNVLFDKIYENTFMTDKPNSTIKKDMVNIMYSNHFQYYDEGKIDYNTRLLLKKAQQFSFDNYSIFNNAIEECQITQNQNQLGER